MSVAGRARIHGARARLWRRVEDASLPDGSPATTWTPDGYVFLLCETATAEVAQQVFGVAAAVTLRASAGAGAARAAFRDGFEIVAGEFAGRYVVEGVIPPPRLGPRGHVEYGFRQLRADEEPFVGPVVPEEPAEPEP